MLKSELHFKIVQIVVLYFFTFSMPLFKLKLKMGFDTFKICVAQLEHEAFKIFFMALFYYIPSCIGFEMLLIKSMKCTSMPYMFKV